MICRVCLIILSRLRGEEAVFAEPIAKGLGYNVLLGEGLKALNLPLHRGREKRGADLRIDPRIERYDSRH